MIDRVLSNPLVWEMSRWGLDVVFGFYRKRMKRIADWGLLGGKPSILDLGCGIGQFAGLTEGEYLGLDLNERYIAYARRRNRRPNCAFQCADAAALAKAGSKFDIVLIVDLLHHLSDAECAEVLKTSAALSRRWVVNFEPRKEETNPLGRWINDHDRGHFIRPVTELQRLYERSPLAIVESAPVPVGFTTVQAVLSQPRPA